MAFIKPIGDEHSYHQALMRIGQLLDARPDTADGDDLTILIEEYENRSLPIEVPNLSIMHANT